jgi:hypothetical protein
MIRTASGEANRRHKHVADAKIQRTLALRMIFHCFCFMTLGGLFAASGQYFAAPLSERGQLAGSITQAFSLYALAFVLLMPALMLDSFRLSNRIVGPICRLRNTIRGISQGGPITPLRFRSGDYWQDIPDQFNAMIDKLQAEQGHPEDTEESTAAR